MKTLIALAAAAALLASTGCCWPLYGERHRHYDSWSDGYSRRPPPARDSRDSRGERDGYRR
jgi:hypothetical protein